MQTSENWKDEHCTIFPLPFGLVSWRAFFQRSTDSSYEPKRNCSSPLKKHIFNKITKVFTSFHTQMHEHRHIYIYIFFQSKSLPVIKYMIFKNYVREAVINGSTLLQQLLHLPMSQSLENHYSSQMTIWEYENNNSEHKLFWVKHFWLLNHY